jgi:hypothetical protein
MRAFLMMLAFLIAAPAVHPGEAHAQVTRKERLKKKIRAMRAAVLVETLDLDEDTAAKLLPVINQYDDDFAKLAQENAALHQKAKAAIGKKDDKALDTVLDDLVANQRARWDLDEKRFADLRKVLTAKQSLEILTVLPALDKKILQAAKRAGRKAKGDAGDE